MSTSASAAPLAFELPDALAAHEPPEARGLARDDVRLMVSRAGEDYVEHTEFEHLPEYLQAGDVLVVNTSATINAALQGMRKGEPVIVHLSTELSENLWVIELRRITAAGHVPLLTAEPGETVRLAAGAHARLVAPYRGSLRLWVAELSVHGNVIAFAHQHGSPIRYAYVKQQWPLSYYQTIFARQPGSAEMPSAARPFTRRIVERLKQQGVRIADIVLHAGVSSLELGEAPYPERYRVPAATAAAVNQARARGSRVVAVGTTVVRALETAASVDRHVQPSSGWTELVVTPERGLYGVDALLTGLHAPDASHLWMLEALATREHLAHAYEEATSQRLLWHEFGDLHLIMP